MKTLNIISTLALLLAACGSDGPGGEDLGAGSQTLVVVADINLNNNLDNASTPNDFTASFDVSVTRDGAVVDDAVVTVESDGGLVELDFTNNGTQQRYVGSQVAYSGSYRVDVTAGDDYLAGAVVESPDVHTFTAPLPGESVPGTDPLEVIWARELEADAARIETRELDNTGITDLGSYTIPLGGLRVDRDQLEDERIRLWRENRISPIGGAGGSSISVELRNEINIFVEPDPSL